MRTQLPATPADRRRSETGRSDVRNGRPELVFFFGIVYIWDAMTVVIQRVYFKLTHGKRIFRMTPIHHAFEMRGWKEVKIDFFFSLIAIIGVVLGLMYVYMA